MASGLLFALEPMMEDWEGMKTVKLIVETIPSVPPVNQKQITGKLKKPCDSLLKPDSDECKEQKSKLEHDLVYRGEAEATDTDLISRQAAIRWVKTECNPYGKPTLDFESGKKVIKHLEQMPSAQPEPRRGEES